MPCCPLSSVCNAATLLALALLAATVLPAAAQQAPQPQLPQADTLEAPLLDKSHRERAFHYVEMWTQNGEVNVAIAQSMKVTGVSAVRVTLRWLGRPMGVGQAEAADLSGKHAADLTDLVARATLHALRDARLRLAERHRQAVADAKERHEARKPNEPFVEPEPMTLEKVGPLLLADLQIARALERIHLPPEADAQAVFARFAPGYHGLCMTRQVDEKNVLVSWQWPASAIAANISPYSQVVQMLTDVGHKADDVNLVARPKGPTLQRFTIEHRVRPGRGEPAVDLVRGHEVKPTAPVDLPTLQDMAHRLAAHLRQRVRQDGSVTGVYLPTSDRYDPIFAANEDAALLAYALTSYANSLDAKSLADRELITAARDAARRTVDHVLPALRDPNNRPDAAAAAMLLLTFAQSPHLADRKQDRDALAKALLERQAEAGAFLGGVVINAPPLNMRTQAMVLNALSAVYEQTRDAALLAAIRKGLDWTWANLDAAQLIETMPWLAMAEFRMARLAPLNPDDPAARDQWQRKLKAMRDLTAMLRRHLIQTAPSAQGAGPADVVGGIDLPAAGRPLADPDAPPRPDWRTAQALAFLAIVMRQQDMIEPADRIHMLIQCGLAARFIAQLMYDEPACFYMRSSGEVLGGVRAAFWQNELGVRPTAMSLIAATELKTSVKGMAVRARGR
jgi:hypothetical protein